MKTSARSAKTVASPSQPKEFVHRRQNRLLRSELASIQGKCSQLERTVDDLRAQLDDERDKTIAAITDGENSKNEQLAELRRDLHQTIETNQDLKSRLTTQNSELSRQLCKNENLKAQLELLRHNNEDLRKSFIELSRELVHQKQSSEDQQKRSVAAASQKDIYQVKLHEALKEIELLKKQLLEVEQEGISQDQRQSANVCQLITKAEDMLNLLTSISGQK